MNTGKNSQNIPKGQFSGMGIIRLSRFIIHQINLEQHGTGPKINK